MDHFGTLVLALSLVMASIAPPVLACDSVGPNAHVGVVTVVDRARSTLTLIDAETGSPLTFLAHPDLLRGIAPKDEVSVKFAPEGKSLRATAIVKARN